MLGSNGRCGTSSSDAAAREQQARQTRERILQAARNTFREHGYGATTLTDIARSAGVAEQTVRATFKTKANLVEHLLRLTIRGSDGDLELQQREAFQHMLASDDAATLLARLTGLAATFKEFELIGDYRTFDDPDRQV